MTNRAGTSFAQNVKTLRMERPNRLGATVFHVARGCLRHLPPVSYTQLDVYKRQGYRRSTALNPSSA